MSNASITAAETIRKQIGHKTFAMFGTNSYITAILTTEDGVCGEGLRFNVKGSRTANLVIVALMPDDTYTVAFYKSRGLDCKKTREIDGIHAQNLTNTLGDALGLAVRL